MKNAAKIIQLSLSVGEAAEILKTSLMTISSTAMRTFSAIDCYGDVHIGKKEATFRFGQGPTGWTTIYGKITAVTSETSELSYKFKGFFWQFLVRDSLKTHLIKTLKPYIKS